MDNKNYAIFRLDKLKTVQKMKTAYEHNNRLYLVKNADLSIENDELVRADSFGDYAQMQQEYLAELAAEGVPEYTIRKDAVLGFEVVLTSSHKLEDAQYEQWKEENVRWLNETFNPKEISFMDENGISRSIQPDNVKHVIVHNDESVPHIHAFIVPIDGKGHLNAKYFTNGKYAMRQMQSSYARAMAQFGLERGVKGTVSSHQEVKRFYSLQREILQAELPQPLPGETAREYKERADEVYRQALAINYKQNEDIRQERNEMHSERRKIGYLLKEGNEDEIIDIIKENKAFKKGLEEYPDRAEAEEIKESYHKIIDWELIEYKKRKREDQIWI